MRETRQETLLRVQYRLTGRDLILLGWLADHGVLTSNQIAHALYPSLDFAQRRLLKLTQTGVVDRFRPHRADGGTNPYHYVAAQLGLEVVAAQRDDPELPRRDKAKQRRWYLTHRASLPHRIGTNQFFIELAGYARTHPSFALQRWWPTSRCMKPGAFIEPGESPDARAYGASIHADGHGVWTQQASRHPATLIPAQGRDRGGGRVEWVAFFVEYDTGTEDLTRLADKITAYDRFAKASTRIWPVLFWLHSTTRERHLNERLSERCAIVPIATGARDHATLAGLSPAEAVWRLHGDPDPTRKTLIELAATVGRFSHSW